MGRACVRRQARNIGLVMSATIGRSRCDTQGELAQVVGVENIVFFEYPDFDGS